MHFRYPPNITYKFYFTHIYIYIWPKDDEFLFLLNCNLLLIYQCGMRSEDPESCDAEHYDTSSSTEEIKQITSEMPARCSSPIHSGCTMKNDREAEDPSSTNVEKLMLLTSRKRSRRLRDDEVVDLTEPRLESFCLPNVDSHVVKITLTGT